MRKEWTYYTHSALGPMRCLTMPAAVKLDCIPFNCRWQLLEVAAGKVKSKPVMLENGMADVVQWTLATAAANKLNVLRSFAHGVEGSFALQIKAG